MTKQDFETVMEGVDKMLEITVDKLITAFVDRITTLENRVKVAENSLKMPVNGTVPPIVTGHAGTSSAANTYEV